MLQTGGAFLFVTDPVSNECFCKRNPYEQEQQDSY